MARCILNEQWMPNLSTDVCLIWFPQSYPRLPQLKIKYYLKHADDRGDHLLVDEDYNLTGIID